MNEVCRPRPASVLIRTPFTFEAMVRERYGRAHVCKIYSALAALEFKSIPSAERAYGIQLGPDESIDILFDGGRLLWPMNYVVPFRSRIVGAALLRLQNGTLDLFASGRYDATAPDYRNDPSVAQEGPSGYDAALAAVWRKSDACVLVGGELYAEGGVPIFLSGPGILDRGVHVASSGAGRHAEPRSEGLWTQPGGFHLPLVQKAIARGQFRIAAEASRDAAPNRYPRVVAYQDMPIDALDLRIDATFREFLPLLTTAEGDVRGGDTEGGCLNPDQMDTHSDLTAMRCEMLHHVLAGDLASITDDDIANLRDVLSTAAAAGRTMGHSAYLTRMRADEDEMIAALAQASA